MLNKRGPILDPWGTLQVIFIWTESELPIDKAVPVLQFKY